jgi:hypothetical protein
MSMKRYVSLLVLLSACGPAGPAEEYGFITRLGRDTISLERVSRRGHSVTIDGVDRFPRVRQRHTEVELDDAGAIRRLVMDIRTPSEPENERERHVVADVSGDSVHIVKRDGTGAKRWAFGTAGGMAMAHVPQMYSLYELYFAAALRRAEAAQRAPGDTIQMRQFYIDREFDRFPLHRGIVRVLERGRAEITHDWLAGTGEATFDSTHRLLTYSGHRTTYKVDVTRLAEAPDVDSVGARYAALETQGGGATQLSVRDTMRATIGTATFTVEYSRPLARGRTLLGDVIPYDRVWRTGANAATHFTTSAAITMGGMEVPAGAYTLWTFPRADGVDLIVNKQTGQWGTGYGRAHDLSRATMATEALEAPVEKFTISIVPIDARRGTLAMEWGPFRWSAPIAVR